MKVDFMQSCVYVYVVAFSVIPSLPYRKLKKSRHILAKGSGWKIHHRQSCAPDPLPPYLLPPYLLPPVLEA